jgi:hypothetical protein
MCARDACLWYQLQGAVRDLHCHASYDIHYFYTSRMTRYFPSEHVLEYTGQLLAERTVIVDLCGTGQSLKRFAGHFPSDPQLWQLICYRNAHRNKFAPVPYAIEWLGTTAIELANLAKHPMVCDMDKLSNQTFVPVFLNPTGIHWEDIPEINTMHKAFALVMSALANHDFTVDIRVDYEILVEMLRSCSRRIESNLSSLTAFAGPFFGVEEHHIRQMLWHKATRSGTRTRESVCSDYEITPATFRGWQRASELPLSVYHLSKTANPSNEERDEAATGDTTPVHDCMASARAVK